VILFRVRRPTTDRFRMTASKIKAHVYLCKFAHALPCGIQQPEDGKKMLGASGNLPLEIRRGGCLAGFERKALGVSGSQPS
jgi:hypothetical protein